MLSFNYIQSNCCGTCWDMGRNYSSKPDSFSVLCDWERLIVHTLFSAWSTHAIYRCVLVYTAASMHIYVYLVRLNTAWKNAGVKDLLSTLEGLCGCLGLHDLIELPVIPPSTPPLPVVPLPILSSPPLPVNPLISPPLPPCCPPPHCLLPFPSLLSLPFCPPPPPPPLFPS